MAQDGLTEGFGVFFLLLDFKVSQKFGEGLEH